ncbi:MAG: hypothetical protein KatS3mg057_2679 [Herpetosiphonaceae bacterium]|nr:MAG: hypothetical protein KatS3mg057_2679 [Herpetosiphonaceae bacterium]
MRAGGVSSIEARAFLLRGSSNEAVPTLPHEHAYVLDLGSPFGGQNRLLARGAQAGDHLCVFDRPLQQFGCELLMPGDQRLTLRNDPSWAPLIQLSPVTSTTYDLRVEGVPPLEEMLQARLYPEYGVGGAVITLTQDIDGYYGQFTLDYPALAGHIHLWVDEPSSETVPRREVIVAYSVGGNPGLNRTGGGLNRAGGGLNRTGGGLNRTGGGLNRAGGGLNRTGGAPVVSPDGQLTLVLSDELELAPGEFYAVQSMAGLPLLPPGKTPIGQAYNLVASTAVLSDPLGLSGSISVQYLGNDVLLAGAEEEELHLHHWDGSAWLVLPTLRNTTYNLASAPGRGVGVYALLAGVTVPNLEEIWPAAGTAGLTTTLAISGSAFLGPMELALVGESQVYTLPVQIVSSTQLSVTVPAEVEPGLYGLRVVNGDGGTDVLLDALALYRPAVGCFYDFFESGAGAVGPRRQLGHHRPAGRRAGDDR